MVRYLTQREFAQRYLLKLDLPGKGVYISGIVYHPWNAEGRFDEFISEEKYDDISGGVLVLPDRPKITAEIEFSLVPVQYIDWDRYPWAAVEQSIAESFDSLVKLGWLGGG